MKHLYQRVLIALLFLTGGASAQNTPKLVTKPAATARPIPGAYATTWINYTRMWEPNMPSSDTAVICSSSRTPAEVKQTTQYFDGLGRKIQTVSKGVTPSGKDFVEPVLYDPFGRELFKYMPYSPQTGNTSDGKFKSNPFAGQSAFFSDTILNPAAAKESIYYGRIDYEDCPGGRVLKTYSQGNNWALEGGNRPAENRYEFNAVSDSVRVFNVNSSLIPVSTGIYPAGHLVKEVSIDENGKQVVTFKDQNGQIILKKVQLSPAPGTAHMGWLCTYQVFNRNGKLAFIFPPKAVDLMKGGWSITAANAHELCYLYRYDDRERVIIEKAPGADSVENIYDRRDRLVITRTGVLKGRFMAKAFAYDTINRPTMTALITTSLTRTQMQTYYDTMSMSNPTAFVPFIAAANIIPMVQTFYDKYDFAGVQAYATTDLNNTRAGSNPYSESMPGSPSTRTKGLVTGKKIWVASNQTWLTSTMYYNDKGRMVQHISQNYAGGTDITNSIYDFTGKVLSTYLRHTNPASTATPQTTVQTMFHYDAAGRIDSIKKMINDDPALQRTISFTSYDESGQRLTERLNATATGQLETLNFGYNLKGWLTSVNKGYVNTTGSTSNWFGMELAYDAGFDSAQYTGRISGTKWKGRNDGIARAFGYGYDATGRLLTADFSQQNSGSTSWTNNLLDFSVSGISYDPNGNMLSMKQVGMNGVVKQTIDSLKLQYNPNSNRLLYVTDKVNNAASQLGDFKEVVNNEAQDYWYDPNGNMVKDRNKDIDTILYDDNDLPAVIKVKARGDIYFVYGGDGTLLAKVTVDTSNTYRNVITHYASGFVYKNDSLETISHERGRVRAIYSSTVPVRFTYDYFIKDNLGNTRMVLGTKSDTGWYHASMETASNETENALFANVDATRAAKPTGYPTDNTTIPNNFVSKTNGSTGAKIGVSKVLRLMAGDTIAISCKGFYQSSGANTSSNTDQVMLNALVSALSGLTAIDGVHSGTGANSPLAGAFDGATYTNIKNLTSGQNQSGQPKAYLNFAFFDDQFNLVPENSGTRQVQGSAGTLITLGVNNFLVKKTGWLYVYTSNESAEDVYFDNLIINHKSGPLLEETHYYPHGVTLAAISSSALKGRYPINNNKFNGKELQTDEFNDGWGLDYYDMGARMYDPQIGRFHVPDPHGSKYGSVTPYNFGFNNPVSVIDPTGKDGKLTGSGTKEDPYVIEANYYYYGLTDNEGSDLEDAASAYNGKGVKEIKVDGKTVYVQFKLNVQKVENKEAAQQKVKDDSFISEDYGPATMGNIVTAGDNGQGSLAFTNAAQITLNRNTIDADLAAYQADDYPTPAYMVSSLRIAIFIHEIGHNLVSIHGDKGMMEDIKMTKNGSMIKSERRVNVDGSTSVPQSNIRAMIPRFNMNYHTDYQKDRPEPNTPQEDLGTLGRVVRPKKD